MPRVGSAAIEPLPRGSVADGTVADTEAVAAAVRRVCERGSFARHVAVAIPGSAAIVRRFSIPTVPDAERDEAVRWEASRQIPFAIEDAHIDYEVLTASGRGEGDTTEVLLAAARPEVVAGYVSAVVRAGRVPVVIDLGPCACQNAYDANYRDGTGTDESVAILDVGAAGTGVRVISAGQLLFTRDIGVGGHAYTEALQKALTVSLDEAERAKQRIEESGPSAEMTAVLEEVTNDLLLEVTKTFGFLRATHARDISRIVVTGRASRLAGFLEMVRDRLGKPVVELDPFRAVRWDVGGVAQPSHEMTSAMTIAMGLALRHAGDRLETHR